MRIELTQEMHEAVKNSPVGQLIDRLIREEFMRGGNTRFDGGGGGNVIQALWAAFMSGTEGKSFREIKDEVKSYASSGNGSAISGE